jgi:hypothetical protein
LLCKGLTALLSLAIGAGVSATVGAQGLGDAAKKEKARRTEKDNQPAPKIYTIDNVLPEPDSDGQPARGTLSSPGASEGAQTATVVAPPRGASRRGAQAVGSGPLPPHTMTTTSPVGPAEPDYAAQARQWRERVAHAKSAAESADQGLAVAERDNNRPPSPYVECPNPQREPMENIHFWRRRVQEAEEKCRKRLAKEPPATSTAQRLEQARRVAADAHKALDAVYEDARRQNIPPGWLR